MLVSAFAAKLDDSFILGTIASKTLVGKLGVRPVPLKSFKVSPGVTLLGKEYKSK
jgi:hypothetical protein